MMRSILLFVLSPLLASALASCLFDTYSYRVFVGAVRDGVVCFDSADVSRGSTQWFWMLYRDSLTRCSTSFNLNLPSNERSLVKFSVENRLHADVTLTDVWARFEWKDEEIFLECGFTMHLGNEQRVVHERLAIVTKTGRSFSIRH